jgi:hypothetical protein
MDLGTDRSWRWHGSRVKGWEKPGFRGESWTAAVELGGVSSPAWSAGEKLSTVMRVAADPGGFRASLKRSDPLMRALGRPNREQVVARRDSIATTLEALELTNGPTLAARLRRGAENLIRRSPASSAALVTGIYEHAFQRPPTPQELESSLELMGSPPEQDGLEDFLWCVVMLPEFQLIR